MMSKLQELLKESAARHTRLCPRQVLGIRMGLLAGKILNLELPQSDKSLFTLVECDGCGAGGIEVSTGCTIDRRTLRVLDYGKLAATFIHTRTRQAVRIFPKPGCRELAKQYIPEEANTWQSQLEAYQTMPDAALLSAQPVRLTISLEKMISKPGLRVLCNLCGEEITNEREIIRNGLILCRACAGDSYYQSISFSNEPTNQIYPEFFQDGKKLTALQTPPIITVIGKSGSGKTTLLVKLIRELTSRGYQLATIKHHSHSNFDIDVPGKDSWRFAQAGSKHIVISAPDKVASYFEVDDELSLDQITQGIQNVDLILVEGYKNANKPTIEVIRSQVYQGIISDPQQCLAIVSDMQVPTHLPLFDLNDVQGICNMIIGLISTS